MIWFLSIFIIMSDGTAMNELRFSNDPKFNNEADCRTVGEALMNAQTAIIGDKGKVYFNCNGLEFENIKKAIIPGEGT